MSRQGPGWVGGTTSSRDLCAPDSLLLGWLWPALFPPPSSGESIVLNQSDEDEADRVLPGRDAELLRLGHCRGERVSLWKEVVTARFRRRPARHGNISY